MQQLSQEKRKKRRNLQAQPLADLTGRIGLTKTHTNVINKRMMKTNINLVENLLLQRNQTLNACPKLDLNSYN